MSPPVIFPQLLLAQAKQPPKRTTTQPASQQTAKSTADEGAGPIWLFTTGGLAILLVALGVFFKIKVEQYNKKLRFEDLKNKDLQKKLKLAVETISKMERNPDLIHSREFNLDYLRMRMDEEVFHFAIVNQIKIKVKEKISMALRPTQANEGTLGIASAGRQVDEMFDVEYEPGDLPKGTKRVLFRIQIRLTKLPTQPTSATISQIIDCLETYLKPSDQQHDTWQPTIQARIAQIHWDQKAKPTPLLVLEQTTEGTNVTFRTNRNIVHK
ncbi:MAG: hypothetical protein SFW36_01180 [Leptolyngbyaceae cyanobacterium bins.59]|nr:hypothetical protein [Leptolyngbyaceae cyanobacterium bins.59]